MPRCSRLVPLSCLVLLAHAGAQGLVWGTTYGGDGEDTILAVARDAQGRVFVCGETTSTLKVKGAFQPRPGGGVDGFVACFDPRLTGNAQLVWSTYIGGTGEDRAFDLVVSPAGDLVTVVGYTDSPQFLGTPQGDWDGFVVRYDLRQPVVASMVWSNRFGGSGQDAVTAIAEEGGQLTIAGYTAGGFPVTPAGVVQPSFGGGARDAFAAQLSPGTGAIARATYLGGTGTEGFVGTTASFHNKTVRLALDRAGDVFVVGPVQGSFRPTTTGATPVGGWDTFVCRLDPALTAVRYATMEGGMDLDIVRGVVVDRVARSARWLAFAGGSRSAVYPTTANALQARGGGDFDFFATQLDLTAPTVHRQIYATLLGGAGEDQAHGVHHDGGGALTLIGGSMITSTTWPTTTGAPKRVRTGAVGDIALVRLRPGATGTQILYSTFFGGDRRSAPIGNILDGEGGIVLAGSTVSTDHPTTPGAFQSGLLGPRIAHVGIHDLLPRGAERFGTPSMGCLGSTWAQVDAQPASPAPAFALTSHRADPGATGFLCLGAPLPLGIPIPPFRLFVNPLVLVGCLAGADGFARFAIAIPPGVTLNRSLACQWVWLQTNCVAGAAHASNALRF